MEAVMAAAAAVADMETLVNLFLVATGEMAPAASSGRAMFANSPQPARRMNKNMKKFTSRGYTLVELVVAVGLFAIVMMLVSGAYIMMIGITRQAQGTSTGIDNLSFALETMTRSIRTGTGYNCGSLSGGDCQNGMSSFYFTNMNGAPVSYNLVGTTIQKTVNGATSDLTDPSVRITSLMFYVSGTSSSDVYQPHVTIAVSGTVTSNPGKPPQSFAVQTGATMRVSDL